MSRDAAICRIYAGIDETADQIVSDPDVTESFCNQVNSELRSEERFDIASLNKRLLNLRRRGEEKGGLIRKRRGYNGRNGKPK
jgi:hypothetical protein